MSDSEEMTMDEEKDKKGPEAEGQKCEQCEGCKEGEKCEMCASPAPYRPIGGATSFAEADSYEEAATIEGHIRDQEYLFRRITDNIFGSEEMSLAEKLAKVKAAATELEGRLEKPDEKGLLGRVKDLIVGSAEKATKTEDGKAFPASDYAYVPDATKPSTWKLRLTSTPGGKPDARIVGAAVAALGKGFRGQKVQIPSAALAGVKAKVRAAWKKANPDKKPADVPAAIKELAPGAFTAFKDAEGNWRWLTLTTNKWRDRDGEIIPAAAHEDYVAYADRTQDMPELRLWHVPGTRVGIADCIDFAHGFVLQSGTFDKGMEDVAESLSKETHGVSHGFFHGKDAESDIYPWYRDFEASTLPPDRAANEWTEFSAENAKEVIMPLSDDKRAYLVKHMGETRVVAIEKALEEKEEALKAEGVDFKEILFDAFKADDPKPEVKAEGDGEADKGGDATLAETVQGLVTTVNTLVNGVNTLGEAVKALQADDATKIAEKMKPKRQPAADGERPSESTETKVSDEEAAKVVGKNLDSDELEKTPGGRGLKQILRVQ